MGAHTTEKKVENEKKYMIPAIVSAGEILNFLSKRKNKNAKLTQISKSLGINQSTCYRILRTLTEMKLLDHDLETKTFRLGPYLIVLGSRASEFLDYMSIAKDYLKTAAKITKSTCAIVQRVDNEWFCLDKEEFNSPITVTIKIGQRFKLNSGATGKLFLAYLEEEERRQIIDEIGLFKHTEQTITEEEELEKELREIKKRGYSMSLGEHIPGVNGLSFPILDQHGEMQFGINVATLEGDLDKLKEMAEEMKALSLELSNKIYL
ncbi:IclR family transcriptional regulator [Halobacillus mangrovi]|uniref:IclR family transcriptional regulator n=1 Tax=Halobacillus mangrovi TaxID=402384 RepID=A0A1W5ZUA2_9BACI|nr:IclR family transcriptional regulator [Halobacillus mangrovi]ARI76880.1 hypothetical protein HM131_08515 [Halobacillus mangrovi]